MTADITVVVPLYNGADFISETLESLARQTLPLHQVIVVDDGSTDDGPSIAETHRLRPVVVHQRNSGAAVARNRGAALATSRYVAFLDQDDLWMPQRSARLQRFIDARPDSKALVTNELSFYLASDRDRLRSMGEGLHVDAEFPDVGSAIGLLDGADDDRSVPPVLRTITTRDLLRGTVSKTTSYLFERETFLAIGGCAAFVRSLDDFWALLNASKVAELLFIDEDSIRYRIHPTSATMTTPWPMPFLTSLAAARFGGRLVPIEDARNPRVVVPMTDEGQFWIHQMLGLAKSGKVGPLLDAVALTRLLGCSTGEQVRLAAHLSKVTLGAAVRRRRG